MAVSPAPELLGGGDWEGEALAGDWCDEQLAEAIKLFEAGDFSEARILANEAVLTRQAAADQDEGQQSIRSGNNSTDPSSSAMVHADSWRLALDELAMAHEDAGNPDRAEALYLRMLAWREGAEQYRCGHFGVSEQLFNKSPGYQTVEDATWFLQGLRPDDGHAVTEVVGLLALGEEVAAKAAIAVWTLALRPLQRPRITECGGLELVAKAVAFHAENAELQAAGCGALRLLCTGHPLADRNRRALIGKLGGAEALAATLRLHRQDIDVQREACGALAAAAHKHPAGARRIIDNDGVMLCLEAMAGCPNEAVGTAACKALTAMRCASASTKAGDLEPSESTEAIWEGKFRKTREAGLQFIEAQLRRRGSPHGSDRLAMQQALLAAALVFLEDATVRHLAPNLVEHVVVAMQGAPGNPRIQAPACGVLWRLMEGHMGRNLAVTKVASSGGIVAVSQAMRDLPCSGELQRVAIGALRNAAQDNDHYKTIAVRAGGIPATVTAMLRFPKDARLQEEAIGALTHLCDQIGRAQVCARLGGIEAVIGALKRHASVGHVAELGCIILCMLCDDEMLRQQIIQSGALSIAKAVSRAGQKEAQHWGCELLRELSDGGGVAAN